MKNIQKIVADFTKARGWHKQLPDSLAKSISIEAAELLELFQWSNPTTLDLKNDKEKLAEVKHELADVLIYCCHLANILELSVDEIVVEKLALANKKYPVDVIRKYSEGNKLDSKKYLEIKKAYRRSH